MWRKFRDRRVLGDYACWVGDEVGVAVAAESEAIAEEALRLVEVDWEVLPFVLDPHQAMKPGAPVLHPEIAAHNVLPADPVGGPDVFVDKGDVEQGLAEAEVVVEWTRPTTTPPRARWTTGAAWSSGSDDRLTVWSNSYEADQSRMHISQMLELPLHKVRVVSPYVGGQFGRGDTGDQPFFLFTALLAKKTGRPVKFRHTRRESFHDGRQPAIYHGQGRRQADGTITACPSSRSATSAPTPTTPCSRSSSRPRSSPRWRSRHIPNLRFEAYGVYTNKLPACMMRGVGNSQLNFILGHIVDVLAEKLGHGPHRPGDQELRPRVGEPAPTRA